nr:gamma-glutamyl-gamma-aminobutyrate hydrolase family protein [Oceanococcus sp. HetDA_MAG_MS8]
MRAVVIRHVAFETLDGFAGPFLRSGFQTRLCDGWDPQAVQELRTADCAVLLGGPIGANDYANYPYLRELQAALVDRLKADKPTLGICLGAQMMALALGGELIRGSSLEIGAAPITLSTHGEQSCLQIFQRFPEAWHWHQDQFSLPPGTRPLASTETTAVQAFDRGEHILACQFHPEFAGGVEPWLVGHHVELMQARVPIAELRAQALHHKVDFAHKAEHVAQAWLHGFMD